MSGPLPSFCHYDTMNSTISVGLFKKKAKLCPFFVGQFQAFHEFAQSPRSWQTVMFPLGTPRPKRGVAEVQVPGCRTQVRTEETAEMAGESQIRHRNFIHYWWIP